MLGVSARRLFRYLGYLGYRGYFCYWVQGPPFKCEHPGMMFDTSCARGLRPKVIQIFGYWVQGPPFRCEHPGMMFDTSYARGLRPKVIQIFGLFGLQGLFLLLGTRAAV